MSAQTTPSHPYIVAWLHTNDWESAVSSVAKNGNIIREVSPMWFEIDVTGHVVDIPRALVNDSKLINVVRSNITLCPLVTNVTPSGTNKSSVLEMFQNSSLQQNHIQEIMRLVSDNNYDGIDLDYEGFRGQEVFLLADFVAELGDNLHRVGKKLTVAIEVTLDEQVLPAWRRIGSVADSVQLMVYSEHTERTFPGPIASLEWSRQRLKFALRAIPAKKLVYGIAIYGRIWSLSDSRRNTSGTWKTITDHFSDSKLLRDEITNSPHYEKEKEIAWFEDAGSVKSKIDIARSLGVQSFAFWRLGNEDPEIWNMISSFPK